MIIISRGETSVERHINNKETRRLREKGKVRAPVSQRRPASGSKHFGSFGGEYLVWEYRIKKMSPLF